MKETSELKHALVAGWFSFHGHGHATAGDLLAAELTCDWLQEAGFTFDLALDPPFAGGIDWRKARNEDYSHVVFVCGPFGKSNVTEEFMLHFEGCRIIGLNLTMNQPREVWNPFDALIERNNSIEESFNVTRPDMSFLSPRPLVPVIGVCLVERYGARFENEAYMAIKRLIDSREMSVVMIDTRLDENKSGLCSPAEIESLLARMDMVITTRLHGTVLSLKNGVPVIAIDPGGDSLKIKRLANEIDWPMAYSAGDLDDETLIAALDFCLSTKGKQKAQNCSQLAIEKTMEVKSAFLANLLQDEGKDMSSFVINHIQRNEQRIIVEIEKSLPW
jgi:hypothetical protein